MERMRAALEAIMPFTESSSYAGQRVNAQFCCAVEIYLRMRLAVRQFFGRGEGIETVA